MWLTVSMTFDERVAQCNVVYPKEVRHIEVNYSNNQFSLFTYP